MWGAAPSQLCATCHSAVPMHSPQRVWAAPHQARGPIEVIVYDLIPGPQQYRSRHYFVCAAPMEYALVAPSKTHQHVRLVHTSASGHACSAMQGPAGPTNNRVCRPPPDTARRCCSPTSKRASLCGHPYGGTSGDRASRPRPASKRQGDCGRHAVWGASPVDRYSVDAGHGGCIPSGGRSR